MYTYVTMLRGINVSGQNKVRMEDLRALYQALGYVHVASYIQSGNVIFTSPSDQPTELASEIERQIQREFGLQVAVVIRSKEDLARVIESNPFLPLGADLSKLHVTFLSGVAGPTLTEKIQVPGAEADEFRILGREIYLHCPGGYGQTKLNNTFWERRLRVPATTRNWNTVTKLLQLAQLTL